MHATPKTTQELILDEIRKTPKITRVELAAMIGITPDGIKYHLQRLTKAGVIRHIGATRSGEWVICK
ncbi:MAG: winged helix-turn-helix domain-containing protein [Alistipes sp.]